MKSPSVLLLTAALCGTAVMAAPAYDPCAGKVTFGVAMGSMGHCIRSPVPAKDTLEKRNVDGNVVYTWKGTEEKN